MQAKSLKNFIIYLPKSRVILQINIKKEIRKRELEIEELGRAVA